MRFGGATDGAREDDDDDDDDNNKPEGKVRFGPGALPTPLTGRPTLLLPDVPRPGGPNAFTGASPVSLLCIRM